MTNKIIFKTFEFVDYYFHLHKNCLNLARFLFNSNFTFFFFSENHFTITCGIYHTA